MGTALAPDSAAPHTDVLHPVEEGLEVSEGAEWGLSVLSEPVVETSDRVL